MFPSATRFFQITAEGIDKIEGPGEFTMTKFHGIKIEATGQNIITLGDGNQIDAQFSDLGKALVDLREAIARSDAAEAEKMGLVADIDTIQSQLAKPKPNRDIIRIAWDALQAAATIASCVGLLQQAAPLIAALLPGSGS